MPGNTTLEQMEALPAPLSKAVISIEAKLEAHGWREGGGGRVGAGGGPLGRAAGVGRLRGPPASSSDSINKIRGNLRVGFHPVQRCAMSCCDTS